MLGHAVKTQPNCRTCGVCCVALVDQEAFCDVEETDMKRLTYSWARRNVLGFSAFDRLASSIDRHSLPLGAIRTEWREMRRGPLKGVEACACVALRGSLLQQVSCSIYPRRPRACRAALQPGQRQCLQLRRMYLGRVPEQS